MKLKDLSPNPQNPRKITDKKLKMLKKALEEYGDLSGIVYNNVTKQIVGGHQRQKSFPPDSEITIKQVYETPTKTGTVKEGYIEFNGEKFSYREVVWDETKEKAAVIAANKGAGEWDLTQLSQWMLDLDHLNIDMELTMFSQEEIENLLVPIEKLPVEGEEDDVPEPPKTPKTVLGDIYKLGDHRIMCGDSTSIDDVEKLMDGQKADMAFTDPPYNTGMSSKSNNGSTRLNHMFDDDMPQADWINFLNLFVSNLYTVMAENSVAYICLDWRRSHELVPEIKKLFKFSNLVIWDKVVHGLGSDYKYTHEFIHIAKKGKPSLDTHQGEDAEYSDVWHIQRKMGKDEDHATKKPIEIVERSIKHASKNGNLVIDLFSGSGSTLIACEKTNRRCFTMEMDPMYCDVTVSRWEKYTGKKAELVK